MVPFLFLGLLATLAVAVGLWIDRFVDRAAIKKIKSDMIKSESEKYRLKKRLAETEQMLDNIWLSLNQFRRNDSIQGDPGDETPDV